MLTLMHYSSGFEKVDFSDPFCRIVVCLSLAWIYHSIYCILFSQAPITLQSTIVEMFKFGPSINHWDFMPFLASESGEMSDDVLLFSKVYPGMVSGIVQCQVFCQWQVWTMGHNPEDQILWGSTHLVSSTNQVHAFLLIHSHGTYNLLPAMRQPPHFFINYIPHLVYLLLHMVFFISFTLQVHLMIISKFDNQ